MSRPVKKHLSTEDELVEDIVKNKMTLKELFFRLFMTRDDNLDLLQLMFILLIIYFVVAFSMVGAGKWNVPTAAWTVFGSVFATLAIAGTPTWIAQLLASRKSSDTKSGKVG